MELSKKQFGFELIRDVALILKALDGERGIYYKHKEYCGQGLIYLKGVFYLVAVYDGKPDHDNYVGKWESMDEFISFFSVQSDFSCSGVDPESKIFYAKDKWFINNQRLNQSRLEVFARKDERNKAVLSKILQNPDCPKP